MEQKTEIKLFQEKQIRSVCEGGQSVTNCNRLKLIAEDGKIRQSIALMMKYTGGN
jgi:hypothetical protein